MRLEGSLDAFSLPDIFSLLSMTKKTGGLHLRRADTHGVVWLRDGLLTGGAADLNRLSLARRIAGNGHVTDEQLRASVDEARDGERGIARALLDAHAIEEADLHAVVSDHLTDTVFDLMRWPDGGFEFVVDEANCDDVGATRAVDDVVAEARRRLEVWQTIDERLVAPGAVLSIAPDPGEDASLARDEWALLALVDGRRTVDDLVSISGRGQYAVVVALAELVGRGLLRVDDASGVGSMLRRQEMVASLETGSPARGFGPQAVDEAPAMDEVGVESDAVDEESSDVHGEQDAADDDAVADDDREGAAVAEDDGDTGTETEDEAEPDHPSDAADAEPDDDEHVADVAELPHPSMRGRDGSSVVPARPEPFKPSRQPEYPEGGEDHEGSDHPEPLAAAMAGGGAVVAPAGVIERDPSVNKSLLLRLIAGVRGL